MVNVLNYYYIPQNLLLTVAFLAFVRTKQLATSNNFQSNTSDNDYGEPYRLYSRDCIFKHQIAFIFSISITLYVILDINKTNGDINSDNHSNQSSLNVTKTWRYAWIIVLFIITIISFKYDCVSNLKLGYHHKKWWTGMYFTLLLTLPLSLFDAIHSSSTLQSEVQEGKSELEVDINGLRIVHPFYILNDNVSFQLIIGQDFLEAHHAKIDFSKQIVSLKFGFLEVAQVPRGFYKLREVRTINFHLSRYLSDSVVSS